MASTPILPFAAWASGTNQNSIPANDNSRRNQILNGLVISRGVVTAQPASPAEGAIYILGATHTGAQWASFFPDDIVIFSGGTWYAFDPVDGVVVNFEGYQEQYTGSAGWAAVSGGGGSVAGSDTQVQFNDGGAFGAEAGFTYNKTTDVFSSRFTNFGTSSAFNNNSLSGDDAHFLNVTNDPAIAAGGSSAGYQLIRINSYGSAGYGGNVHFCRYRGTQASPTAVQSGDTFMSFGMRGWDSSAALSQSAASWAAIATENWTGSAHGIKYVWQVTANGSTTRANGMELASTGLAVTGDVSATGKILNTESIIIACSDQSTAITTGTAKVTFRMPYAFTLSAVRASVNTAPTGSTIVIDINESGTTVLSTKLSIDASEKTSTTAATPPVISDTALADDAEITIDFDQVGSTIAGAGVMVYLIGKKA